MIVAGRLFVILGLFGLVAGVIYWSTNSDPELAGVQLLLTFFAACLFIGVVLLRHAPGSKRFPGLPDTGLAGSADPQRGAADEHGHIHHMAPTLAPVWFSLCGVILLGGVVFRDRPLMAPVGIGLGLLLFLLGSAVWYRNVAVDTRAALAAEAGHAVATVDHHAPEHAPAAAEPAGPPGPVNWFEQVREAAEAGDPDWAAAAYATDAVYYEPANPPHEGRDSIRAYLNSVLAGHRGLVWEVDRIGADGDVAIVEWRQSYVAPDGDEVADQPGVSVIQIGPAGIVYHRDYR
jgi:uncharacterized protein (TIGR02246 family)